MRRFYLDFVKIEHIPVAKSGGKVEAAANKYKIPNKYQTEQQWQLKPHKTFT